jgi:hypothetical protein
VAAVVTPCRHDAGATVLDKRWQSSACGSAAGLGGDVGGTNQITVPMKIAEGAAESAAVWLGTCWRQAGQVEEVPRSQVLPPAHILPGDALGVADQQGADLVLDGEGDHPLGRLMLGLVDATAMASFDPPQASQMAPPTS